MAALIVGAVLLVLLVRRRARKTKRATGADALTDALGLVKPYNGPRWRVGDKPWI